jgi:hypothetical protein
VGTDGRVDGQDRIAYYRSQKRTPKASFDFMRKVIAANALPGV